MTYDSRVRDRYRLFVRATTATVAAGAMAATGWLAGGIAHDHAAAARAALDQRPSTVVSDQPVSKSRATARYVSGAAPSTPVGQGGTVGIPSTPSPTTPPPTYAPPPPPPPPPAPSNGS